ncbi:MAG: hypothetical protein HC859_05290 [Bacteroidia bacterium]|nr:hypothetical protein [Bacteroidia bacterium]
MKLTGITFLFLMLTMAIGTSSMAQAKWERLGTRVVNYGLDRDIIPVTYRDGAFTAIQIEVKGGAVNMHKCVIHFENGGKQEVELRHNFRRGSDSRVIDLVGNKRFIEKIEFWYDTKNLARRRAVVTVFGRK